MKDRHDVWVKSIADVFATHRVLFEVEPQLTRGRPDFLVRDQFGHPTWLLEVRSGKTQLSASVISQVSLWTSSLRHAHPSIRGAVITSEFVPPSLEAMAQVSGVTLKRIDNTDRAAAAAALALVRGDPGGHEHQAEQRPE